MRKFKVGDKVVVVGHITRNDLEDGDICEIVWVDDSRIPYKVERLNDRCSGWLEEKQCSAVSVVNFYQNEYKATFMSLLKKAKDLFATEPQKSLRMTGIFDESDTVTDEGLKIWATRQIIKDTTFQDEVVKPLADQIKKEE